MWRESLKFEVRASLKTFFYSPHPFPSPEGEGFVEVFRDALKVSSWADDSFQGAGAFC
jgi:hypothetical protein